MMLKTEDRPAERWWDIWIAIFAMLAIVMVAGRLWVTEWTQDLYILVYLAFLAGLAGLALGYSRFSPLLAALISTVYGTFCILWLFGTTVDADIAWRERIFNQLAWRIRLAFEQFSANQSVSDPILFLVMMAALLWIMSATATFILIRQGAVWPVLVPLGFTLLVIGHYDQDLIRNSRYLMSFIFFTLLIVGRMNVLEQSKKWLREGINTTPETHADFTKALIVLTLAMVIFAWVIPLTPQQVSRYADWWTSVTEPWDRFRDRFADILVLEAATDTTLITFFGDNLGLGSGTPISEEVVFTVKVDDAPPAAYRNYWHTRSYDRYADGNWSSTPGLSRTMHYPDSFQIAFPDWEGEQTASYTFTSQVSRMNNLYVTGLPTWIDRPVETVTQLLPQDEENLVALNAVPELYFGETYQVEALVSVPTASELRRTSTDYPSWLDRYLQLPEDFSPPVAALAAGIARQGDHPYNIAVDITRYLRINIEYARTIPPVPAGADPMEWFLFEEQTGFCNYYASAQVLMLRSLGIPARFVVGYAQGEYDSVSQTYTVRKMDSHAWPEVFFIGYGWVPFEPTVSQPALILPAGVDSAGRDGLPPQRDDAPIMDDLVNDLFTGLDEMTFDDQVGFEALGPRVEGSTIAWIMLVIFLVVLGLGMFVLQRPDLFKIEIDPLPVLLEGVLAKRGKAIPNWLRRWSYYARMSAAERAYRQLCRSIRIIGQPLNPADTPSERAQLLVRWIPQAYQPALVIIGEYQLDKFSNHAINQTLARSAGWQVLRLALTLRLRKIMAFGRL
jgi:transglutaminase-like putative cysteine protease